MKKPLYLQILLLALAAWSASTGTEARATPLVIRVDGMIYDNTGAPLNGTPSLTIAAYFANSGGTAIWGPTAFTPTVTSGRFTIDLDASVGTPSLQQAIANAGSEQILWFEIAYAGTVVRPRIRSRGTAFAVGAASTDALANIAVSTASPPYQSVLYYGGSQWNPGSIAAVSPYIANVGDTMTGALNLPANTLNAASAVALSLQSISTLVRTDANRNLVAITANVQDSDLANLAGLTASIQPQLNLRLSSVSAVNIISNTPALTVTGGTGSVLGSGVQLTLATATGSSTGLLTSNDWNTFNNMSASLSLGAQSTNTVDAGPLTGSALPGFRALTLADLATLTPSSSTFLRGDGTWNATLAMPVGTIEAFAGPLIPSGWLGCNGGSYLRSAYPALFAAIGTAYGAADSTHFNVPDFRGQFLRGTDNFGVGASGNDPDSASRTALYTGGNTGNTVGSFEADQFASHTHYGVTIYAYSEGLGGSNTGGWAPSYTSSYPAGGNETRGRNIYVNYIIRAVGANSGTPATVAQLSQYLPAVGGVTASVITISTAQITSLAPNAAVLTDANSNLISVTAGANNNVLYSNGSNWNAGQPVYYTINASCPVGQYLQGFDGSGNAICVTVTAPTQLTFTKVAGGDQSTCGILSDTTVMCWGYNGYGQLGNGTTTNSNVPVYVRGVDGSKLSNVVDISTGYYTTCAVKSDGSVWCWGYNPYGQVGDNTTTTRYNPVQVVGSGGTGTLANAVHISLGIDLSCALLNNNTIWCWGYGGNGALGNGANSNSAYPVQVSGITTASGVSAGGEYACAVKADGSVWCWGYNDYGVLGNNSTTNSNIPVQVVGLGGTGLLSGATQVAASSGYRAYEQATCAIVTGGAVYCWGEGTYGTLGNGGTTNHSYPVQVTGMTNAVSIAVGDITACVAKSDGSAWCWGYNSYGEVGDGTTTQRNTPVQVVGPGGTGYLSGITQVTAVDDYSGSYDSIGAVSSSGRIYTWGYNGNGQLGNNTTTTSYTPVGAAGP